MKKILLSALSAFVAVGSISAQTVAKKPLIEHFTQASCGPCAGQNPIMYATLNAFGTSTNDYTKITYQTSWPGVDPMNAAYPGGPQARVAYYNVSGVPDASLNGGATDAPNTIVTATTMANAATLTTPYNIKVTHTWNSPTSIDVRVAVVNVSNASISSSDRLHLGMVEDSVVYNSAPGTNGETQFFYVLRQFYDASTGTASNTPATIGAIPPNDSLVYTFNISSVPSSIRDLTEVSFVAFVQNNATKVVDQSAKSQPAATVPGTLSGSAVSASTSGSDYCDLAFTPSVSFTNDGATPITSVTAQYTINGGTPIVETFSGNLTQGQSTTISFPATNLLVGSTTVAYEITDVNSGGVLVSSAAVDITDELYNKLASNSSATPISEDFQGLGLGTLAPAGTIAENPDGIRAYVVDNTVSSTITWNLGGHGNSNGCFRWDFVAIPANRSSTLMWQKLDLTGKTNNRLSFARAHALWSGNEPDRLKVSISTDCGANWTSVWDKQGTALATAPNVINARFYPQTTQWVTDTVDLSAYDNTDEVILLFEGISGAGNSLYLDDINIFEATVVNNVAKINDEAADVRIMPNPVNNQMTLEFTMLKDADANISIVNALGQKVQNVTTGSFNGINTMEINTSELASGVYFLNITTTDGTTTAQRFIKK